MASALQNNGKNVMLDRLAAVAVYGSLHTADPGAGGSSEVTGGSPAYARKSLAWGAASSGSVALVATFPVWDVPASTTVAFVGLWSAVTAGTYYGAWDVTDEAFTGQGTYTLTAGSWSL